MGLSHCWMERKDYGKGNVNDSLSTIVEEKFDADILDSEVILGDREIEFES